VLFHRAAIHRRPVVGIALFSCFKPNHLADTTQIEAQNEAAVREAAAAWFRPIYAWGKAIRLHLPSSFVVRLTPKVSI
jgi:hypothetical protein